MTNGRLSKAWIDLLNKCDPPARIMLHTVPLRIIRLTALDETLRTFRVEQLVVTSRDPNNPIGNWATLSSHTSEIQGGAYTDACKAALAAQDELKRKLTRRLERAVQP